MYNPSTKNFASYNFGNVLTHELGHRIDDMFGFTAENSELTAAVKSAKKKMRESFDEFVKYSWGNDDDGFISDIFSAIDGTDSFSSGHKPEYWQIPGRCEAEIFANLFGLEAIGDTEKLNYLRKHFPEIMEIYDNLDWGI